MVEKFSITVPELSGEEERFIYIYTPTDYEINTHRHYPVLYMFDGQNLFFDEDASFGTSWKLSDYLDFMDTPIIVAALDCNSGPNGERMSEYSPFGDEDPDYGYLEGKGKITMDFFVGEFKQYIDENYRTIKDRDHTFIGGSSMGGFMSLYAIMEYNDIFSKAAVLSPTLWFGHDELMHMIQNAEIDPYTVVYTDYGTFEFDEYQEAFNQYKELVLELMNKQVMLTSRLVPFGDHSEGSWHKQIPAFMDVLLYDMEEEYISDDVYEHYEGDSYGESEFDDFEEGE